MLLAVPLLLCGRAGLVQPPRDPDKGDALVVREARGPAQRQQAGKKVLQRGLDAATQHEQSAPPPG